MPLSTEAIQQWWEEMKSKGAEYLSIGQEDGTYKLHARTHGAKQRLGQKTLGTRDRQLAERILSLLLAETSDSSPESAYAQYVEHRMRMVESCKDKERHLRYVQPRIKTAKTNASRLKCHLLPFCHRYGIDDVKVLYRREVVGRFLDFLAETVPAQSTCKSIVKTVKAFLHWYDRSNEERLANWEFEEALRKSNQVFAHKIARVKTFLDDEAVRNLLAKDSDDPELRARILAHLVGGLRYNEVEGLRWRDLNPKLGNLIVRNAKGGVARYAQFPKCLESAFGEIRRSRRVNIMDDDFIFTHRPYGYWHEAIQRYVHEATGNWFKDEGSNCLRRSGCHSINMARPGLGDKQLGHANTSRITDTYYNDRTDFNDVNKYWDDVYARTCSSKVKSLFELANIITMPLNISAVS